VEVSVKNTNRKERKTRGNKIRKRTKSVDRPIKRKMIIGTSCRCLSPIRHSYRNVMYLRTDYYEAPLTPLTLGSQFSPAGRHSDIFSLMYFFTDFISLLYIGYVHTMISPLLYFVYVFISIGLPQTFRRFCVVSVI
jgi:hypothetical protein